MLATCDIFFYTYCKLNKVKNSIRHMGAYVTATRKTFWNIKKFERKFSRLSIDILCVHIKFHGKTDIFYDLCKKDKKESRGQPFFYTIICLFTHDIKKYQIFMEQLCERVEFWVVCIKFCVWIFWYFKIVFKTKFKNQKHTLPSAKTPSRCERESLT
jgi:hypothetical protein